MAEVRSSNKGRLGGKVAVITGGNRGLGFASATRFAQEGAKVVIFGRDAARNEEAVHELTKISRDVISISGSITSLPDIERLMAETTAHFGGIDILYVNHGVAEIVDFLDITEEMYDRVMDTNTKGAFFAVQKAVPHLRKNASVILCTSSAVHIALADQMHYTASKQALDSFRRTMSAALVGRGIRVNAVCPGLMMTEMAQRMIAEVARSPKHSEELGGNYIPMGRPSGLDEVVNAVLFLASDESTYMLGGEIIVDGGVSMAK